MSFTRNAYCLVVSRRVIGSVIRVLTLTRPTVVQLGGMRSFALTQSFKNVSCSTFLCRIACYKLSGTCDVLSCADSVKEAPAN